MGPIIDVYKRQVKHLGGNFQAGLALSRYNRNHSRWLFGADYVKKHYSYKDIAIPKAQFTGERCVEETDPVLGRHSRRRG